VGSWRWFSRAVTLSSLLAAGNLHAQTFSGKAKPTIGPRGTRRALVVGISTYDSIRPQLNFAARDAETFAAFLRSPQGFVAQGNLRLLLNDSATAGNINRGFDWLEAVSRPGDEVIIYFAGHGDVMRGSGFLLAYNARPGQYFDGGTIRISDLEQRVMGGEAGTPGISQKGQVNVLLITDACRSGKLLGGERRTLETTAALVNVWTHVAKLVSSGPEELSHEGREWGDGHGIFTYFLIAALSGRAAGRNGVVTVHDVAQFVYDSVKGDPPRGVGKSQVPYGNGNTEWEIAWVRDSTPRATVRNASHPAPPETPDSATQRSLAAFQRSLAAGLLFDAGGAWDVYRRDLANTTQGPEARLMLISALEEQAYATISEYLSGLNNQAASGQSRRAAAAIELTAELVGEKSMRLPKLRARHLFFEGYAYAQKRDYQSALQTLQRSISLDPDPAYAYNARGFAFLADQQLDSAWLALSAARERAPSLAYPLLGLALVALESRDPGHALALIDSGATLQGPQAALQAARAIALVDLNRRADAEAVFRIAVLLDPDLKRAGYVPEALREMPKAVARLDLLRGLAR
jgi:tetratricopeptide (TPR) repeat protein